MKNYISLLASILTISILISSCATSNDVASNRVIQKRKHLKGYHITTGQNGFKKHKTESGNENENVIVLENNSENHLSINQHYAHAFKHVEKTESEKNEVLFESESTIIAKVEKKENKPKLFPKNAVKNLKSNIVELAEKNTTVLSTVKKRVGQSPSPNSNVALIVLVILAFLIPPLAVFLYEGVTTRFWIDLILTLVGLGLGSFLLGSSLIWLGALAAVLYALFIVLELI